MILKLSFNVIKGMRQDISPSKASPEYIFDARNIRLTARGNDTLLSISNEQGSKKIYAPDSTPQQPVDLIKGKVLGYCVLNNYLVTFSTDTRYSGDIVDYITRIYKTNDVWFSDILYSSHSFVLNENGEKELKEVSGRLNFGDNIQTLGIYENENILKVYWVDGINLPRVINIVKDYLENETVDTIKNKYTDTSFDFVLTLQLNESVTVNPIADSSSNFKSGVILYAFTYYNLYGLESNIAYVSDLYNVAYNDRGANPEESCNVSFKITLNDLDPNFNKIRLYSIYRSSINSTPYVKRVTDLHYKTTTISSEWKESSYFKRFNDTPTLIQNDTTTVIDNNFPITILSSTGTHGSGLFYVFYYSAYKQDVKSNNLLFQVNGQKFTFPTNATDGDYIAFSLSADIAGPSSGGRLVATNRADIKLRDLVKEEEVTEITYIDNNNTGESIDPTLLLYIGGEEIIASTLLQKDNTLFLGNIVLNKPTIPDSIKEVIKENNTINIGSRTLSIPSYTRDNTLINSSYYDNTTTFKDGEHYRLGVQFLYKTGLWSEPIVILSAYTVNASANVIANTNNILYTFPILTYTIPLDIINVLKELGYKRARALIVNPSLNDRKIIAQGMLCPTIKVEDTTDDSKTKYYSSWFLRTIPPLGDEYKDSTSVYLGTTPKYKHNDALGDPTSNTSEIEGYFSAALAYNKFTVNQNIVTFHSPDVEFDESLLNMSYDGIKLRINKIINFTKNYGDIDILTSTPAIRGRGFYHTSVKNDLYPLYTSANLMTGGFYKDAFVLYADNTYKELNNPLVGFPNFIIYPWQCSGSLNNDCTRPTDKGVRSAVLKRKVISNYKWSISNTKFSGITYNIDANIFNSNELSLIKLGDDIYFGNVDTLLSTDDSWATKCVAGDWDSSNKELTNTSYKAFSITKASSILSDILPDASSHNELTHIDFNVRMKYKSTPHIVIKLQGSLAEKPYLPYITVGTNKIPCNSTDGNILGNLDSLGNSFLFLGELYRENVTNPFGGDSDAAYKANLWIPSGPSVLLKDDTTIQYLHGDCYFLRYDCLKTYPFTQEDENSIVEIGSFMVETRVNIDGRYDRNKGLFSYLNVTPLNFNLLNSIYTLKDNFFNYRILGDDIYKLNNFSNTITWSKEKMSSEEIDTWTNITMTNTFDMDGNLGLILSIENYNNELYCFLDKGISRILFNNRVLIPTGDNVPIEISNGYKVLGKVYLSNTVGCLNLKAIKVTPNGIYFSDLYNSGIYLLNQLGMLDISTPRGFTNWVKECLPDRLYYDANNGDLYLIGSGYTKDTYKNCLCFSEKINEFTSFMDYYSNKYMFNIQNNFYAIKDYDAYHDSGTHFMQMFSGDYMKDYHITYIANLNPINDKIFNTLEFRADTLKPDDKLLKGTNVKMPNICPFNKVTVWNEYQEGEAILNRVWGKPSNLKEKFRTWRVNIPRDKSNNRDRIRNPWVYIKLEGSNNTNRMLLHDLLVYYYDNSIYSYGNLRQL